MSDLYQEKDQDYYSGVRFDLLTLFPAKQGLSILEVGAGSGENLVYLKVKNIASKVVGVEKFLMENTMQQHEIIDSMIIADLETDQLDLAEGSFDLILCPDVIEHLIDPWHVLEKLRKYLRPGGEILISVPNIRFFKVLISILLKGRFEYETSGIMDRTHLRWFCRKDLIQLLEQSGYRVTRASSDFEQRKEWSKKYIFNLLTFGLFKEFFIVQNFIAAKKTN